MHGSRAIWFSAVSLNRHAGTLRGMHFQAPPHLEAKVRCTRGAIFDVMVDLREGFRPMAIGMAKSQHNHLMLYIPKGFAHGFLSPFWTRPKSTMR